jgi:DNA polymerase-1
MNKDLFVMIDGSSYLYRAFHALPPLNNSQGHPTGAIHGVLNMLRKLLLQHKPAYVAVVFDAKGKTFRHNMYPDYKANRPPMPEDLRYQIEPLHEIIRAMHLPLLIIDGVEADDVIGTLAKHATQAGLKTLISTGDKDMAQLVNDDVSLINTMTNVHSDREQVIKKFGVGPETIIDYLALIGDTADNVPGVPKVGPKTAVKWLEKFKTVESIIKNADSFTGKVGENLRASLEQLPLSKELVTIKTDVELPYKISDLIAGKPDNKELSRLYNALELRTLAKSIPESEVGEATPDEAAPIERKYHCILKEADFNNWLEKIKKAELVAFDTETTSLNYMDAEIVGLSFAITSNEAIYIPVAHDYEEAPEQLSRDFVLNALKDFLEDPQQAKVGHNLKYDKEVLLNHGINLQGIAFDTMLESYVVDSTASRHNLDSLAHKYLNHTTIKFEDVAGSGAKQVSFDKATLEKATPYAAEDAAIAMHLHEILWPKIKDDEQLLGIFQGVELPLVNVLVSMERNGVLIDSQMLAEQSKQLETRGIELQKQAFELSEEEFNMNSPKQLQEILYEKLDLPILKKTPKGQPSTAEPVLQELAHDYELPKIILEYRSLSKLKSTYTDKLPEQVNFKTDRVHCSYNQAVAGTGRLSSSDPNLQNIPIRTAEGRKVRQAFIAGEGNSLIAADYSQIELRIMAHLSQDKGLIEAFAKGLDVHKATASQVFAVDISEVTADQRRKAKAINFGLIYGMSAFGLAKQLGVERAAAQAYIDSYFEQYPQVQDYMENTRDKAHEKGYVETLLGRRLYLPEINAKNMQRQKAAERAAINAPMQGTAADIIKIAMINVQNWLADSDVNAKLIMQVHDELVFEVANPDLEETKEHVQRLMEQALILDVPLLVEAGVGKNWDEAH